MGGTVRVVMHDPPRGGLWDEEAFRSNEDGWGKLFDSLERAPEADPEQD